MQHFRGMFAFALWDVGQQRLFLARDRLGKKPLYYYLDDERFVFGSEMKAILTQALIPRRLNHTALDLFFSLGYVPAPHNPGKYSQVAGRLSVLPSRGVRVD